MGTKHTPGPLYVSITGMLDDYKDGPFAWAVHAAGDNPRDVYETALIVCSGDLDEDEARANAMLYAAAPDLLAACKAAYLAIGYSAQGDDDLSIASRDLRRAIAKAEGGA